jgi:hypothetical protein
MKKITLGMCLFAIVLWASASVWAQGQGKGQGGGDKERVKEGSPQSKAQENAPAPEATKNAGKGKAAKQADESGTKQGGPKGKKGQVPSDTPDKGKGKGQEKQAQALQKQLQHEQAKHMERQARLTRIRELAVKKGDTEMVARVDKLIAKEQEVYGRKQGKMQGQPRAVPTVGPNDVGARKGKSAVAEQKQKSGKQADEGVKEQKKTEAKQEKAKNE